MPDLGESWKCLRCGWAVDLPCEEEDAELYHELIDCIRRHRWGHIREEFTARKLEGLLSASAEEVWAACGDEPRRVTSQDVGPAIEEADRIVRRDRKWLTP